MSTNYYVITDDPTSGEEIIHLGQWAAGQFTFRAHPDRTPPVMGYEAWVTLLDLGEIQSESRAPVTRDEMIETANRRDRWSHRRHNPYPNQFDEGPRRFTTVEFC